MEFVIVSGISGAGKTSAIHAMEDIGFYCVDNIPPALLSTFYELCDTSADERMKRVAVVLDIRVSNFYEEFSKAVEKLKKDNYRYKTLFLDAATDVIVRRYRATRRKHPLCPDASIYTVNDAVELERGLLARLKQSADFLIDTSFLSSAQLKERICTLFLKDDTSALAVTCVSFGFKYGVPTEADIMFDVRCLPNPFYIEELKYKTGLDAPVSEYVLKWEQTQGLLKRMLDFIDYTLPLYSEEGKAQLVIAIGCTGGKHRSVALTQVLYDHLIENKHKVSVHHRDLGKV
ncbi:MAG: RNase adapter RapZ [Clostridia bacterium]|nr:RNase adapter RapZ [Clostridia bacterium]MBQ2153149.1 RNase adapter RapZ [Clostridia bacterium]